MIKVAGLSDIEWTDATWNPISGCKIISPGCTNCYAMRMAARLQAMDHAAYQGVVRKVHGHSVWTGRIFLNDAALEIPLRWRAPRKIFVNSMSDLFQDGVPDEFILKVWDVMARSPHHVFQILTKRPENMLRVLIKNDIVVLPNVWVGTSVESAKYTKRIQFLRQVPAAVRFISFEPLISAVGKIDLSNIQWAIVGGESGPGSRPMKKDWVEEIRTQCRIQKVAFFFKQWGGVNKKATGRKYRGRTWDAYPVAPN
ncbi:MAG TPA: phage Gp37/Gp68 family protein [Rhizomicrobium sp.]|nr:phage Gp37/Gp68 family protein [Rhizomicrobium sp.]